MKTVRSFTTNNLVEGHDTYVKFMNARFENLKKDGKKSDLLFYRKGFGGSTGERKATETERRDICKWHCITLTYNIWCELVKDHVIPDNGCIQYKKHIEVSDDILKQFKYRVEQAIKIAGCDYNERLSPSSRKSGTYDACRYLVMYWAYLDLIHDCKTQRYFPNGPTVVRAQRVFDYDNYTNPFFMNGKFHRNAIRGKKETKEVKSDTTNCVMVEDLDLTHRTFNILKHACINTLDDILRKSYGDLIKIKDMGKNSLNEIVETLRKFGYEYIDCDGLPQPIKYPRNVEGFDKNKLLTDLIDDRRLTNPLYRVGIHTVGDFLEKSDKELLKIRTFGAVKLRKVKEIVDNYAKQTKEESVIDIAEQAAKEVEEEKSITPERAQEYTNAFISDILNADQALLEKYNNLKDDYDKLDAMRDALLRNKHDLETDNNDLIKQIENLKNNMAELKSREMELNIAANPKNLDTFTLLNTVLGKMKDSKMEYIMLTIDGMVIDIHPRQNFTIRTREAGYGRV